MVDLQESLNILMIYMSAKVRAVPRVPGCYCVVVRTFISTNLPASDKENCGRRARMEVMRHQARYCVIYMRHMGAGQYTTSSARFYAFHTAGTPSPRKGNY
jgi:hypothetical protein